MKTTNDKDKILLDSISEFLERFGLKYAFRTYNKNHYDALQIFQEKGVFQIEVCQRDLSDIVYLDFNIKRFEDNHYLINFYPKDFIAITTRASLCMKDYTQKDLYNFVWSTMQSKYDIFMRGWATQSGGNKEDFYNIIKQTRAIHIETLPWDILTFQKELDYYTSLIEDKDGEKQEEQARVKAKRFVKGVGTIAKNYGLPVFVVTDGASLTDNNGCEAVEHARAAHKDWELKNNITDDGGEK